MSFQGAALIRSDTKTRLPLDLTFYSTKLPHGWFLKFAGYLRTP
jgi:hypothetical protein